MKHTREIEKRQESEKVSFCTPPRLEEKNFRCYLGAVHCSNCKEPEAAPLLDVRHPRNCGTVVVTQPYVGASDELGCKLLEETINGLNELKAAPRYLIFMHEAVRLCMKDSELLPILKQLQKKGCSVRICEISVHELDLEDAVEIGRLVSVRQILDICLNSEKVIRL